MSPAASPTGAASRQVHGHAGGRVRVVGDVGAVAPGQRVRAAIAAKDVVAGAANQPIGADIAIEIVGEIRALQALDPAVGVALGSAARAGARSQVDRHRDRRVDIADMVEAGTADNGVRPEPAGHQVIAGAAVQHIDAVGAGDRVVEGRPDDVLDTDQRIAFGLAGGVAGGQIDADALQPGSPGCSRQCRCRPRH